MPILPDMLLSNNMQFAAPWVDRFNSNREGSLYQTDSSKE